MDRRGRGTCRRDGGHRQSAEADDGSRTDGAEPRHLPQPSMAVRRADAGRTVVSGHRRSGRSGRASSGPMLTRRTRSKRTHLSYPLGSPNCPDRRANRCLGNAGRNRGSSEGMGGLRQTQGVSRAVVEVSHAEKIVASSEFGGPSGRETGRTNVRLTSSGLRLDPTRQWIKIRQSHTGHLLTKKKKSSSSPADPGDRNRGGRTPETPAPETFVPPTEFVRAVALRIVEGELSVVLMQRDG